MSIPIRRAVQYLTVVLLVCSGYVNAAVPELKGEGFPWWCEVGGDGAPKSGIVLSQHQSFHTAAQSCQRAHESNPTTRKDVWAHFRIDAEPVVEPTVVDPPVEATAIKWNPGHYFLEQAEDTTPDEICSGDAKTYFAGGMYFTSWRLVETAQGVYDWSGIDEALKNYKNCGKQMWIFVKTKEFNQRARDKLCAPEYMFANRWAFTFTAGSGTDKCFVVQWDKDAMGKEIAFFKAVAARYNSDPNVEGILFEETSNGLTAIESAAFNYDPIAYYTQLKRRMSEVSAAAPNTLVVQMANWDAGGNVEDLFTHAATLPNVGISGPDPRATSGTNFYARYGGLIPISLQGQRFSTFFGTSRADIDRAFPQIIFGQIPVWIGHTPWTEHHLNHFWWPNSQGGINFDDVVAVVKARVLAGDTVETACPGALKCQ